MGWAERQSVNSPGWVDVEECVPELAYPEELNNFDDMDMTTSEVDVLEESCQCNSESRIIIWDELRDFGLMPGSELRNRSLAMSTPNLQIASQ